MNEEKVLPANYGLPVGEVEENIEMTLEEFEMLLAISRLKGEKNEDV